MHRSSWLLQHLEYATRAHHVAADADRLALLGSTTTRERYLDYLKRTYTFEAPIEARWQETPGLSKVIDVDRRVRTPFLASDLQILGVMPQRLAATTAFTGVYEALGWMYVVERGRRMNGMLYRHLHLRLPQETTIAANYLLASSPIGTRWQQLGVALDELAKDPEIVQMITSAAHRGFRAVRCGTPARGVRAA